jgi:hypothetical protein
MDGPPRCCTALSYRVIERPFLERKARIAERNE